jgi:response regulator RpfG family c-di-GMP phosphodiesterase
MPDSLHIYHDLFEAIIAAMEARDLYTARHSERVSEIAQHICRLIGLDEKKAETIHLAAHVHDIGKVGVPDSVLSKPGALSKAQWALMADHAQIGYGFSKVSTALAKSP